MFFFKFIIYIRYPMVLEIDKKVILKNILQKNKL